MTQAQHLPDARRETAAPEMTREAIARAGRIVLKVGTGVLTHPDGSIALARLFGGVEAASRLRREGREVLIVPPAPWDFDDRVRYLNLHETLQSLFRLGVVPVVNENDAISLNDRVYRGTGKRPIFDDNDRLGALVASELAADLIVLLTDVPGVMTADPRRDAAARLIPRIDRPEDHAIDVDGRSEAGRGGMASKLEAASVASRGGCHTVIASGLDPGALDRVLAGEEEGDLDPAARDALVPQPLDRVLLASARDARSETGGRRPSPLRCDAPCGGRGEGGGTFPPRRRGRDPGPGRIARRPGRAVRGPGTRARRAHHPQGSFRWLKPCAPGRPRCAGRSASSGALPPNSAPPPCVR